MNAKFKYENGKAWLVCSMCDKKIRAGYEMCERERKALFGEILIPPVYCIVCKHRKDKEEKRARGYRI